MRGASPITSRSKRAAYYPTDDDQSIASYSSSAHVSGTITPTSSYSTRRGGRATTPSSAKSRYSYKSRLNGLDAASVSMMPDSILEKAGRVRVAVRCRPPFDDEVISGVDVQVVHVNNTGTVPKVSLEVDRKGKRREFCFDVCLGPETTQDDTYTKVAKPIVDDVLRGFNGTVMAYGQTGTGKTYTMGILDRVKTQPSGIIPMSLKHIFSHMANEPQVEWSVSMSFLQIYLETIQDLLVPPSEDRAEENLAIREDPKRGCFVDGLQEYIVKSYSEAVELLNWGLENRVMASTLMNITSSRSHTVLTVYIQQRGTSSPDTPHASHRTLRSKLILVDLAGSERVRKTTSRGARLSEARAINSSLSALGNVIAALASTKTTHVPYRDSKLTRILTDSLGGKASTVLIATMGPAGINQSETLSTLLFASRCMHVRSTPVLNEDLDYASLCAQLQMRLASLEREWVHKEHEIAEKYESRITELSNTVIDMKNHASRGLVDTFSTVSVNSNLKGDLNIASDSAHTAMLRFSYNAICQLYNYSTKPIRENMLRETKDQQEFAEFQSKAHDDEMTRRQEVEAMTSSDPLKNHPVLSNINHHLTPLSIYEANERVSRQYGSNNSVLPQFISESSSRALTIGPGGFAVPVIPTPEIEHPPLESFKDDKEFKKYVEKLCTSIFANFDFVTELLHLKDKHFTTIKAEQARQAIEKRTREEELVNWSYVLKYLLSTNSKLRQELRREQANYLNEGEGGDETVHRNISLLNVVQNRDKPARMEDYSYELQSIPSKRTAPLPSVAFSALATDRAMQEVNAKTAADVENDAAMRIQDIYRKRFTNQGTSSKSNNLTTLGPSSQSSSGPEVVSSSGPEVVSISLASPPPDRSRNYIGSSDDDGEEAETIESIIDHRVDPDGVYYKVHWKGSSVADDEWFLEEDLTADYGDLVSRYNSERDKKHSRVKHEDKSAYMDFKITIPLGDTSKQFSHALLSPLSPGSESDDASAFSQLDAFNGNKVSDSKEEIEGVKFNSISDSYVYNEFMPDWLVVKISPSSGGGKSKWEPRFCTVENGFLYTFNIHTLKGSIPLRGAKVLPVGKRDGKFNYTFSVTAEGVPLVISASDDDERKHWVRLLTQAAKSSLSRDPSSPPSSKTLSRDIQLFQSPAAVQGFLWKQSRGVSMTPAINQWQRRLFRLSADMTSLDYYDFSLDREVDLNKCVVELSSVNFHDVAVVNGYNPIWFQNQCKYSFSVRTLKNSIHEFSCNSLEKRGIWASVLDEIGAKPARKSKRGDR